MNIPLNEFEQHIDDVILERGYKYFTSGAVTALELVSTGSYEAVVEGTEHYVVQFEVANEVVVSYSCDCPYNLGPVCKHLVAALFYLQKDELGIAVKKKTKKTKTATRATKAKAKPKTVAQQVDDVLEKLSHEELVCFVAQTASKDRGFRTYFLSSYLHLSENRSQEFYKKQIRAILSAAAGRDKYIDRRDMSQVAKALAPFVDTAKTSFHKDDHENVFFIATALLECMTTALDYADDSSGDLGYFIDEAMDLLRQLTREQHNVLFNEQLFTYCITTFNKGSFKGWDWYLEMLNLAAAIAVSEMQVDSILQCLESVTENYERGQAQLTKLDLLVRFKDQATVTAFVNKHISNPAIREKEIESAFASQNMERVIKLANDGIQCDKKDKPGLLTTWYSWLLTAAQATHDTAEVIAYARHLFINSNNGQKGYYTLLKDTIQPEDWNVFLEKIMEEVSDKKSYQGIKAGLISFIYIEERWWDRLLMQLKQDFSLERISYCERYLASDYTAALLDLYSIALKRYVDYFTGRSHYKTACSYLRRMQKLGGHVEANELIAFFKTTYPKRKALMDELNQV